jgi:hypothetical protein
LPYPPRSRRYSKQAFGLAEKTFADPGQFKAAALSLEQAAIERFLEPLDLLAHRPLRQVKAIRGHGHAAVIRDGDEGPHEIDVEILGHGHIMYRNALHQ